MSDWRDVYDWAGLCVRALIRAHHDPVTTTILDVGAGQGKYGRLLPEYVVDACEVWRPYVDEYRLRDVYREVFICDVREFVASAYFDAEVYDVVVLGDVLEHLPRADAEDLLSLICELTHEVLVVIPYRYVQGPEHGNDYQRHLQDDLTPELMTREYPMLRLVALETREHEPFKGVYRRNQTWQT